jgi:tRNA(fMet)-specific endonuclease VapC
MMYVLDTNTLIYFFKEMGNISANMARISPQEISIPSIVVFELETGIAKSISPQKRAGQLAEILGTIRVLPFGLYEAKVAGHIRATLERQGQPIGAYDVLIAATALAENATLITHNIKEFERVPQLKVEDWF